MKKPTHEQILNASGNGVIATDAAGAIIFSNSRIRDLFDLDPKDISGRMIGELLPIPGKAATKALETGKSQLGLHVQGKDRSMAMNISLIREGQKVQGAICSFLPAELLEISARELEFSFPHNAKESYERLLQ